MRKIAKGRVWTGKAALENGLVDHLGGFNEAIRVVKEEAGIPANDSITLRKFPREKTTWQKFMDNEPTSSEQLAAVALVRLLQQVQPVASGIRQVVVPPFMYGPVYEPMNPEIE